MRDKDRSLTVAALNEAQGFVRSRDSQGAVLDPYAYPPFFATNSNRPKMTIGISAMHT